MVRRNGGAHPPGSAPIHPSSLRIATSEPPRHSRFPAVTEGNCPGLPQSGTSRAKISSEIEGLEVKFGGKLGDFLNFAVPNARRADLQPFAGAVDQGAHRLEIDIPAALGDVMR